MRDMGDEQSGAEADQPVESSGYGPTRPTETTSNSGETVGSTDIEPVTGKSLGVDICVSHPDLLLRSAVEACSRVTVELEQMAGDTDASYLVFTVTGDTLDGFESALESDRTVTNPVVLERLSDRRIYRVEMTDEACRITPSLVRAGGRMLDMHNSDGQWAVRAQFRSRNGLSAFRADCSERGIAFRLDRLYWTTGDANACSSGLTAEQQVALETAHEAGYFNVPREISQAELAEMLDISPSAVSQRIRRGMNQIIGSQLELEDD